ncbi:MAG TPA: hypothetical protein VGK34_10235, partial [Armatimonadota bacterium]
MPSINLIAARRSEKLKLEKQVSVMFLVVVGLVAITIGLFSFMTARVISAGLTLDKLNTDLKKIEPTVQKIQMYETQIKELTPKLELLADSRESTMLWSNVMHDISSSMATDTWLINLQTSVPTQTNQADPQQKTAIPIVLTMNGTSSSQTLVGETMLRLTQCREFDRVDLDYTKKNGSSDMDALDFSFNIKVHPIAKPVEKESTNVQN